MITYTKETGCYFDNGNRHYHLLEMMDYKGKCTSDIIAIWDFDNNALVGYTYGANTIGIQELDEVVTEAVREYEAKQAKEERAAPQISYRFTKEGVKLFLNDSVEDIFSELDKQENGDPAKYDFYVSCGSRSIRIPCGAEEYELLTSFLEDAWEVGEYE